MIDWVKFYKVPALLEKRETKAALRTIISSLSDNILRRLIFKAHRREEYPVLHDLLEEAKIRGIKVLPLEPEE